MKAWADKWTKQEYLSDFRSNNIYTRCFLSKGSYRIISYSQSARSEDRKFSLKTLLTHFEGSNMLRLYDRARAFIQKVRYSILVFHCMSSSDIFNGSLETPRNDSRS